MSGDMFRIRFSMLSWQRALLKGAIAAMISVAFTPLSAASGVFTATGAMAIQRVFTTSTLLPNGKVLVAGGETAPGVFTAEADLYDPSTGTFTPTGNMTIARGFHTATLLSNGKVLIAGGEAYMSGGLHYVSSAELYDPATGTFTATGNMTNSRSLCTATLLNNGKVLIVGGSSNTAVLPTCELYDPSAGTFTSTGSMNGARRQHMATLLSNGNVLVAGGYYTAELATAEVYNTSAGTWSTTGNMASARRAFTATLLPSGKVLVAGGYNGSVALSSTELYDPSAGTFASAGNMTVVRFYHTANLLQTGKVLLTGDSGYGEQYDPAAGTFTATNAVVTARTTAVASLLPSGKVLISGGNNGSTYFSSAEVFDPQASAAAGMVPDATITAPGSAFVAATGLPASMPSTSGAAYAWSINGGTITGGLGTNAITFTAGSAGTLTLNGLVTTPFGISAVGTVSIPVNALDVSGTYADNYGITFTLFQNGTQVWGTRPVSSSVSEQITATLSGNVATGTFQNSDGSTGNFRWTFAPDASSYTGLWASGTGTPNTAWNGTKQAGISVQISPASALMKTGATQAFQAYVAGSSNKGVTWTTSLGSIDANGTLTAPTGNGGTGTVTAICAADTTKTATATVMATPTGVMDVSGTYTDSYGYTFTLFQDGANVWATRAGNQTITGTMNGNVLSGTDVYSGGTLVFNWTFAPDASSFTGLYAVSPGTPNTAWNGTKQAGITFQISPTSAILKTGGTQAFKAFVAGSFYKAVIWTTTFGSIDANGLLTAPTGNGGTGTVTATCAADTTKTATATVMATPTGVMDVSGTYSDNNGYTFTLFQNGTMVWGTHPYGVIAATLNGNVLSGTATSTSQKYGFTWTFAPDASSFTGLNAVYPATPWNPWNGTKQVGVSIQISPTSALMKTGATQAFQAYVAGSFNKAVTWGTTAGTVDSTGLFTAPTGIGGNATVTVTSGADTTKTATATVMATPTGVMDVSGTYSDNNGYTFTLFQNGTMVWGTHPYGVIAATLNGNVLSGTATSTSQKYGFTWTFAPDASSFTGLNAVYPATPWNPWNGTKQVGVSIQISPTSALMKTGATQAFQAYVAGSFNKAVSWSTTTGTVDSTGLFTAPTGIGGNATVTATSGADTTKTATATVMATPTGVMDVSGTYSDNNGYTFTLFQNGTMVWGTHPYGTIAATLSGNVLSGTATSLTQKYGFTWIFAPDASSFTGLYAVYPATPWTAWNGTKQTGVSIQVSPLQSTLNPTWSEGMLTFVAGSFDKSVSWKVEETSGGTISSTGTYTAPPAIGTFHVDATTGATPTATAVATIQVAVSDMGVLPAWISLRPGVPTSFTAMMQGVPVVSVTWAVTEGAAGGSVDTSGRYTAPTTPGTYHVVATSIYDATKTAVAEVHVSTDATAQVDITPYVSQIGQGGTQQFTATVSNASNSAVTWSTNGGTINASTGLYTAPNAYGNYTVTATSVEDPRASDTASVVVSSGTGADATFTYDLNGNLTGDGTRTFEWDAENRLVAVQKGTHRSEFGYDGFGHRVEIRELDADGSGGWAPSVDTKYVWEGAEILESRSADGSTSLQRYYTQGFMDSDGTALYYTRDHLGSTRELVDAFGAIRARYDYDPYGRMTKISGDKDSPFLYTGHLWHSYSGLYLALYREYDVNLGRWISRDPLGVLTGFNSYIYVYNNPIRLRDRDGRFAVGALVGAVIGATTAILDADPNASLSEILVDAAIGAGSGALAGLLDPTEGFATAVVLTGVVGAGANAATQVTHNLFNDRSAFDCFDVGKMLKAGAYGMGGAALLGPSMEYIDSLGGGDTAKTLFTTPFATAYGWATDE